MLSILRTGLMVIALALSLAMATSTVSAANVTIGTPLVDIWNSAVNPLYGYRPTASAFGSGGDPTLEDLFVTQLLIFDSTSAAAAGQGASNYVIQSATVTLVRDPSTSYVYDPTFDPLSVYTSGAADDPGSPMELYGSGFRSGVTANNYVEGTAQNPGTPWGLPAPPFSKGVRLAFPTDGLGGTTRDISSHVQDNSAVVPFAVGTVPGLSAGDLVTGPGVMNFDLQLSPDVIGYLQKGLDDGRLAFHVASHLNPGGGALAAFPSFFNKESGQGSASLTLNV
ncbi:MAG: hypothetical protein AAGA03_01685, partial [Planctomycetota bacterium]